MEVGFGWFAKVDFDLLWPFFPAPQGLARGAGALTPLHVQKSFAHHPQIAQRKQHREARRVLGKPPVAHLGITELLLDHAKRVFHLRPDARLGLLQLVHDLAHGRALVLCPAFARAHGRLPFRINGLRLFALGHPLVARISEHVRLLSMHQRAGLRHVVDVGRRAHHAVHQA